ncbi:hypothetical protein QKU48_gp1028 [Fadolivirus algeromassiliense]|jgi:hypothetical protein|uniref:Zinc finger C2H2-type protein n=1 Tax=Fadolivirus FV1/VV64 TaxID=3070911 RepID=A0A7D3QWF0_9VIRU|nr:hypothetical protein QKU48_gp1028 [Fadolivirus algeromassiliense]QKF94486.1 hypothetical protein Fadolivirus_1_1028 [Fadolivirus FV1/VV64]
MKYKSNVCNYETNDKSNINRHENSVAHKQLSENYHSVIITQQNNTNKFKCDCGKQFQYSSGLSRHKNHYCENNKQKEQTISIEAFELMKKQMEEYYQQQLKSKEMEVEIKYLKQQNQELKSFVRSGKYGNTTYNISIKKYVQEYFSDAPALEGIKDYAKLKYDGDDFVETLVHYYNNQILHKYLGDFIVLYYVKANPSEQSIWNSDVSRLTYLIKELLSNNDSIWNHDPKGYKTKNYIVNPLLKYVKNCLNKYWMDNIDSFKIVDFQSLIPLQEKFIIVHKIKKDIDNGILADEIVKYIAPKFYMNKINTDSDTFVDHFIEY